MWLDTGLLLKNCRVGGNLLGKPAAIALPSMILADNGLSPEGGRQSPDESAGTGGRSSALSTGGTLRVAIDTGCGVGGG